MTLCIRITNENGMGAAEVIDVDVRDGVRTEVTVRQILNANASTTRHVYPGREVVVRESND